MTAEPALGVVTLDVTGPEGAREFLESLAGGQRDKELKERPMFGSIGLPEIILVSFVVLFSLAPVAIGIWLVVTLVRIRSKQDALEAKIDALARGAKQP